MSITDYKKSQQGIQSTFGGDSWVTTMRDNGLARFDKNGFPTVKDEEWRYTNLKMIKEGDFIPGIKSVDADLSPYSQLVTGKGVEVVFIDGHFSEKDSTLHGLISGVNLLTLDTALKTKGNEIQALLKHFNEDTENPFTGLNDAMLSAGTCLFVDDKVQSSDVINIIFITTGKAENSMTMPRSFVLVGQSAKVVICETHIHRGTRQAYFKNTQCDIVIGENSHVEYYKAQLESFGAYHISNTRMHLAANSHLESFALDLGAKLTRNTLHISLNGDNIHAGLDGLYALAEDQHVDNHSAVDHRFPHCVSDQLYKGLLDGKSRGVFNGKIFVRQAAQKTDAYQLNRNVILSDNASVDTKPQLEINADDVRCTHGATIGQMSPSEVFYLQSRGIDKERAIDMLSHGFAEDALNRIVNDKVRTIFNTYLHEYFFDAIERRTV